MKRVLFYQDNYILSHVDILKYESILRWTGHWPILNRLSNLEEYELPINSHIIILI